MSVKSTLKTVKLNESLISIILGAVVVIVSGLLIMNYFTRQDQGVILPTGEVAETTETETEPVSRVTDGKTTHIVQENDNLWTVAERYYNSGYNWIDIAEANEISSGNDIAAGQELIIPDVEPRSATVAVLDSSTENISETTNTIPTPTVTPTPAQVETTVEGTETASTISGTTYTVVRGDTLWDIAVRAYGDGYRWVEIAQANELVNPDLIHAGNVFTIPRT